MTSDLSTHGCIAALAREIGADFHPTDETPSFLFAWTRELARHTRAHWRFALAHDEIAETVGQWLGAIIAAGDEDMPEVCRKISHDTRSTGPQYDGWPAHPSVSVVNAITLGCIHGLTPCSRWPAEAGTHVWRYATGCIGENAISTYSRKAWLRHVYAEVCNDIRPEASDAR